jgi:CheY-like chemotaxis protein/DNA-binding XRE family transcriptional regulator
MTQPLDSRSIGAAYQAYLGLAVKSQRLTLGLTQEELAWRANMHRSYVADIERGGRNVTLRIIANLAQALQVSVGALLHSTDGSAGLVPPDTVGPSSPALGEILLVEDNPQDAELAVLAFKRAKFMNPVRVARDGQEALDLLLRGGSQKERRAARLPQLVLLDLNLPKVTGLEVLRRLKGNPRTRAIPVVVLTMSRHDRNIIACAKLGAENYIIKPVGFDSLTRVTPHLDLRWVLLHPVGEHRRAIRAVGPEG